MGKITLDIFLFIGIITFAAAQPVDVPVNASACPLEMNPPSVVTRYGDAVSVNCSTTSSTARGGMGWEAEVGATHFEENVTFVTWIVETLDVWEIKPECYIKSPNVSQCRQTLSVTVYKEPDSVSISQTSHTGPMVEGTEYQLQCDVISVAPVRNLTVIWYKAHKPIHKQSYDNLTVMTPVNESSTLTITPHRDDNGALIYCETRMNLGPLGPNYFPMMRSKSHVMTVYYPPTFLNSQTETPDRVLELPADEITSGDQLVITPCFWKFCFKGTASNNVGIETKQFIVNEAADPPTILNSQTETPDPVLELPADEITSGDQLVITTCFWKFCTFAGICNGTASNNVGIETKQFIVNEAAGHPGASGTTAMIVVVFLVLNCLVCVCVVYHRRKNTPQGSGHLKLISLVESYPNTYP